jgi:hypothetical protein
MFCLLPLGKLTAPFPFKNILVAPMFTTLAIGSDPEPLSSSPHPRTLFLYDPSSQSMLTSSLWVLCLECCMHFSSLTYMLQHAEPSSSSLNSSFKEY